MAPPQQSRVLRCCSCRLFQAHQKPEVKRSLKWTCKACGEKQSFLRDYGEGSGADCRRHVQKLNLLQGQASELSLRKESMSAAQPPRGLDAQDSSDTRVTVEPQADTNEPDLLWMDQPGSVPVTAPSKWAQFLLLPGNSSQIDPDPLSSIQKRPRPASPAQAKSSEEGCFFGPTTPPPQATPGHAGPCGETPGPAWVTGTSWAGCGPGAQGPLQAPPLQRCSLFTTGEDFDDDL